MTVERNPSAVPRSLSAASHSQFQQTLLAIHHAPPIWNINDAGCSPDSSTNISYSPGGASKATNEAFSRYARPGCQHSPRRFLPPLEVELIELHFEVRQQFEQQLLSPQPDPPPRATRIARRRSRGCTASSATTSVTPGEPSEVLEDEVNDCTPKLIAQILVANRRLVENCTAQFEWFQQPGMTRWHPCPHALDEQPLATVFHALQQTDQRTANPLTRPLVPLDEAMLAVGDLATYGHSGRSLPFTRFSPRQRDRGAGHRRDTAARSTPSPACSRSPTTTVR
jgi:hypothetical protein